MYNILDAYIDFDQEEYDSREFEPLGEMATIGAGYGVRIQVNPDLHRVGVPYFKAFNNPKLLESTKVCRLHFLDEGMEYHKDYYRDWRPNKKDILMIRRFLQGNHKHMSMYTNWQMTCWLWNFEYGAFFDSDDIDTYMSGQFDELYEDHPSYVPSTTPIPETWVYNPPKGKRK